MKFYTYRGERHSIAGWSRKLGAPASRIVMRLRRGVPFRIAVSPSRLSNIDKSPTITYRGETRSLRKWAKKLRLSYSLVYSRYKKGFPNEKVLSRERLVPDPATSGQWKPTIFVKKAGERLPVSEWARRIGIPANTIYRRIAARDGDTSDADSILCKQLPPGGKGIYKFGRLYKYDGLKMTVPQWAKRLHCTPTILYRRIAGGLPPEKVFVSPMRDGRSPLLYTKDGITLPLTGWAKRLRLSIHTLRMRQRISKDLDYVLSPRRPRGFEDKKRF